MTKKKATSRAAEYASWSHWYKRDANWNALVSVPVEARTLVAKAYSATFQAGVRSAKKAAK